jgi:LysM repeat protein
MTARGRARYLAPVAVVAVLIATIVVAASVGGGGSEEGTERPAATTAVKRPPRPARRTYVVREGDSLLSIANRTGVDVERLRALNPAVDEQALQVGQRIRLRP